MFKATKTAMAVALILPGVAMAEIEYELIGVHADPYKEILEFTWESTRDGGNVSKTAQIGVKNKSKTFQSAGGTASTTVIQLGDENKSVTAQDATSSSSFVYQEGQNNGALVIMDYATDSKSTIEQYGESHQAEVGVWGEANTSIVIQDGYGQTAGVAIAGSSNTVDSVQVGSENEANISVYGDHNGVDNDQGGWGNTVTTYVGGTYNSVKTSQWGEGNEGTVAVYGNGNKTLLQQNGIAQIANLKTVGDENTVKTDQFKSRGSRIDVTVKGDKNRFQATQQFGSHDVIEADLIASNNNDIYLLQEYSGGNLIDIDFKKANSSFVAAYQTGWNNTATVSSEGGAYDTTVIKQAGDDNKAKAIVK